MSQFIALSAAGVAEGALVALAALGFLLIYNATGVVNFAQGDLITLGAYIAIWAVSDRGMVLWLAYPFTVAVMFVVGVILERVAYAPLRGRSVHVVVITTLGAAVAARSAIGIWQGSTPRPLRSPLQGHVVRWGGAAIAAQRVAIVLVTMLIVGLLGWTFTSTPLGRQLRAVAADRETARLYGIRVNRLSMLAFGLSSALAGVAGILAGPLQNVGLDLGFGLMLGGFAAAILGGFGSFAGVVAGGLMIGLTEKLVGGYVGQSYSAAYPFVLMIGVIALRPTGVFARGETTRL